MVEDRFTEYFAEKLWEMIPAVYRHEDGLSANPGVLRSVVEAMAEQAANVRRSHDRLWEDQFIELCDNWAVPYLADLVGTRLVSALNSRSRKVDVAKTIYYRRRKGTPAVLEELISDITGWEGQVAEGFRSLARARHGLDQMPRYSPGRFTGTPSGGTADLRTVHAAEVAHGPFGEFYHTPDLRRPRGENGRYGIQRLLFFIYRLRSFEAVNVTPRELSGTGGRGFTFDPSGRDIPLFMPRIRPHNAQHSSSAADWGRWRSGYEWELPAPMRCRILGHAEYQVEDKDIIELVEDGVLDQAQADELTTIADIRYINELRLRDMLASLPASAVFLDQNNYEAILRMALIERCGKQNLYPNALHVMEGGATVARERVVSADLGNVDARGSDKRVLIDPEKGRVLFNGDVPVNPQVAYHYGLSAEVGAGTYDRRESEPAESDLRVTGGGVLDIAGQEEAVILVGDSLTYHPVHDTLTVQGLDVVAADRQRPYVLLAADWVFDSGEHEDSALCLDGLWVGAEPGSRVVVRGDFETVTLKHMTLDPGGAKGGAGSDVLPAVTLALEASVELLVVESSIMGPIIIAGDGYVGKVVISDSIIHSIDTLAAMTLPDAELHLERVTVIGDFSAQNLWATDSLIQGVGDIFDTQSGCFRFSAAQMGSRLPHQYRNIVLEHDNTLFTSRRFGDPGYMQLSENAPESIIRGGENGSEMGAYNALINPVKFDGLRVKVEEYMPFGLLPVYIFES